MLLIKRLWQKAMHRTPDKLWAETQEAGFSELVDEFSSAIADIRGPHVAVLKRQVARSETPRELWFLRERIFLIIAGQISEGEAALRVRRLDEHMRYFVNHHKYEYRRDELPSQPASLMH